MSDWRMLLSRFTVIGLWVRVRLTESAWIVSIECSVAAGSFATSRLMSTSRWCTQSSWVSRS